MGSVMSSPIPSLAPFRVTGVIRGNDLSLSGIGITDIGNKSLGTEFTNHKKSIGFFELQQEAEFCITVNPMRNWVAI